MDLEDAEREILRLRQRNHESSQLITLLLAFKTDVERWQEAHDRRCVERDKRLRRLELITATGLGALGVLQFLLHYHF